MEQPDSSVQIPGMRLGTVGVGRVDAGSLLVMVMHPQISASFAQVQHVTGTPRKGVYVPYTQGKWEGELGTDLVSISPRPLQSPPLVAC